MRSRINGVVGLEPYNTPIQLELGLTTFAAFADAYQARWTVVRMAYEGWNKKSIADCLKSAIVQPSPSIHFLC
jgi:hypothetical protein